MTQKPLLQNYILPNAAAKEAIKQTPLATASSIPALQVSNLAFAYDKGRKIFSDVSFSLQRGEIMQILGANGSGKSTLMNCLAHQLKPQQGQILVEGDELGALPREELARRIAYVPQLQNNSCAFTVRDYVTMGRAPYLKLLAMPGAADYALADQAMEQLRITHLAHQPLSRISGGERQQAQIARALVQQSRIILFDEPTNHLDYGNQHRMLMLIHSLAEQGYTVITTTHIPDSPLLTGGKVGIFHNGAFRFGAADELITSEALQELYHIQAEVLYLEPLGRKVCFCRAG